MEVVTRLPDGSEKVQRFSHPSGGRGCLADLDMRRLKSEVKKQFYLIHLLDLSLQEN